MCAQKSIVYLVHAMQTRTQGWLSWRIFKIKVFLPPYAVLCVLCLLVPNGSLTSCVSLETLKKQPFLFPCAPPNTEALLFMLMALWKKSCWWTRCCCSNLGGFGIESCSLPCTSASQQFSIHANICVSRKCVIYLGCFFLLNALKKGEKDSTSDWEQEKKMKAGLGERIINWPTKLTRQLVT